MIKAFLSHSSRDKKDYVKIVSNYFSKNHMVYDELTFEEGDNIWNQVIKGIKESTLFVIFISNNSLNSKWVKGELVEAQKHLKNGQYILFYPIIIEDGILHDDKRIPAWLRNNYNLKSIKRPSVASRRIHQKLREISWNLHPELKRNQELFVGRNDKIEEFERRYDDFDRMTPFFIITSGLKEIGRRTFMRNALIKCAGIEQSYRPYEIVLIWEENIEDLIIKLNDLGISANLDIENLLKKNIAEKVQMVKSVLEEIRRYKEILFIVDDGCLIGSDGEIADWFLDVFKGNHDPGISVCIAARYRVKRNLRNRDDFFCLDLQELNPSERKRLLKKWLELQNIDLSIEDFNYFSEQLRGFPNEAKFCVDLIREKGIKESKTNSYILTNFSSERVSILLQNYVNDEDRMDFLRLLAHSEIFSTNLLSDIAGENKLKYLEEFERGCICEFIGDEKEFVRLNDAVRDFIQRNRLEISDEYKMKIDKHVRLFVDSENKQEHDSSDYIFSLKKAMENGMEVDSRYLLPSHYIKCMRELYNRRKNLNRVIDLADRVLYYENNMSDIIIQDIRYYKCLALARLNDKRVLEEVKAIKGPRKQFVQGFYYRLIHRWREALEYLSQIESAPILGPRAMRELVLVYLQIEEFEIALELAKKNYEANKRNQYYIQAYFDCLIYSQNYMVHKQRLSELISELCMINLEQAQEMAGSAWAIFIAKCENDYFRSIDKINDVISQFPDLGYPILTKFEIALWFKNKDVMNEALDQFKSLHLDMSCKRQEAYYLACCGKRVDAIQKLSGELNRYPENARNKILNKINVLANNAL